MPKSSNPDEIIQLIYDVINFKYKDETIIAKTGRLLDDGSLTLRAGAELGKVWVTMANGQPHQVWALQGVADYHNITVEVRYNIHEELFIDRITEAENIRAFGAGAPVLSIPQVPSELDRRVIETKNLAALRIRANNPVDLGVFVPESYYEWQGIVRLFGSGSIAVTAPSTVGTHWMVLITLNRNTNALVATTGTEYGTVLSIGLPQLNEIDLGAEHLRLGGARVANGQTIVTTDDVVDGRLIFSQWPGYTLFPSDVPTGGELDIPVGYRTETWGKITWSGKVTISGGLRIN